jgi:hypothetical protein
MPVRIYAVSNLPKELISACIEVNFAAGYCPPDPSCLPPKDKAASTRSVPAIKSPLVERRKAPPGEVEAASRCPRGDGDNGSDHSDQPLAQKLAKATSASKSRKKAGTKGTRAKRNAPKAKADTKRAADRPTERTARTSGATAAASSSNSRKRGDEEQRGHEETALPVALPRVAEDLPDDVAPPPTKTKRAGVLQEKGARAPRKRKELAKNVEDGVTVDNEVENGPPEKKRRRADPQNATVARYVGSAPRLQCYAAYHMFHICPSHSPAPEPARLFTPSFALFFSSVAYPFLLCV